jgi:hypothetical protein
LVTLERRIKIWTKATDTVKAMLTDENPQTAEAIWKALPIRGNANRWGDEIYFPIPLALKEENARAAVENGAIAYWPPGKALCIFFGPTPASENDEPRAASPVNVFARVSGEATFRQVHAGDRITIEKDED